MRIELAWCTKPIHAQNLLLFWKQTYKSIVYTWDQWCNSGGRGGQGAECPPETSVVRMEVDSGKRKWETH